MTRTFLASLLVGVAAPAVAQHAGHMPAAPARVPSAPTCTAEHAAMGHCKLPQPPASPPTSQCTAEHAAMGHCKLPAPRAPAPAPAPTCTAEHAAMGHCKLPVAPKSAPTAACTSEHAAMGHCKPATVPPPTAPPPSSSCPPEHAAMGHCKPADQPGNPHAGHGGVVASAPPVAPPPSEALSGPAHAADVIFGGAAMMGARENLRREYGDMRASKLLIDRLEWSAVSGRDGYLLDAQGWYGGDINKLWLKSEVEGDRGRKPEQAEAQVLWSRAIDPWFDVQAGFRFDATRGPNRAHLVLGVQGLAPYWYEVDGALFLSNKGELTARGEAEYDLRITQKLILQPLAEIDLSAQNIEELGIGAGLSTAELGLRMRYQVSQQFAPYVGLSYERAFGKTRRFRRSDGEDGDSLGFVAGLRVWF